MSPGSSSQPVASVPQPGTSLPRAAWLSIWPFLPGIALALVMQLALPSLLGPFYTRMLLDIGIAVVLAVSLNIVNGMTGQFSIGHAAFMTVGAYTAGSVTYYGSLLMWDSAAQQGGFLGVGEWMFAASCLVGGLAAAAAGYVVGLPSLRLRGDYLAIVTLGFGEIMRVVLQQTNPTLDNAAAVHSATWKQLVPPPVGGAIGFDGIPKYTNLFWVYLLVTLTVVISYRLKYSSVGRAMLAVRDDEIAAQAMGVNISRIKVLAFVLGAFFAGTGGGLFAHESGVIVNPKDAGFQRSFDFVIMAVLGGRGSISGVALAAALLTILPEALRDFDQYRLIVYALLLIGMMLLRPQGLFGIYEIWQFFPRFGRGRSRSRAA